MAIKHCERILEMEPGNNQAAQLIEVIKRKRKKDAMIGAAVLGEWEQPIRTRYLGHVTDYQPIRDQYFLVFCIGSLQD